MENNLFQETAKQNIDSISKKRKDSIFLAFVFTIVIALSLLGLLQLFHCVFANNITIDSSFFYIPLYAYLISSGVLLLLLLCLWLKKDNKALETILIILMILSLGISSVNIFNGFFVQKEDNFITFSSEDGLNLSIPGFTNSYKMENVPSKEGYVFEGYKTEDGVLVFDSKGNGLIQFNSLKQEVKLEPIYRAMNYTINFDYNGGDDMNYSYEATYNAELTNFPLAPTKNGYHFIGWGKEKNNTSEMYTDANSVLKPIFNSENYNLDSEVIFYAHFEINKYTLTFEANGGETVNPIDYDWQATITNVSTRIGYRFDGWYDDLEYSNKITTMPQENTKVYAKWSLVTYTLSFASDEVVISVSNKAVNYEGEYILPVLDDTIYYTFAGWTDGIKTINSISKISSSIELKAKWTKKAAYNDFILVSCVEDVNNINNDLKGDYILTRNINMGGIEFSGVGSFNKPFIGTFNGNDYEISNWKFTGEMVSNNSCGENTFGFFIRTNKNYEKDKRCSIKNFNINNVTITPWIETSVGNNNRSYIGTVVGLAESTDFEYIGNHNSTISFTKESSNGEMYIGGIVGKCWDTNLKDCYSNASIYGKFACVAIGGIAGHSSESTLNHCGTQCNLSAYGYIGFGFSYVGALSGTQTQCNYVENWHGSTFTADGAFSVDKKYGDYYGKERSISYS